MNNGRKKRAFGATFRSLNDLDQYDSPSENDGGASANNNIKIQHIQGLPDDKAAQNILRRIHSEFHTIIERRGWTVTSITEMCCCGDGIDCLKKRKSKVMPNNVLGYNRTSTSYRGKIHDIHLRLRRPGTHELIDYESIAATMCHELAHCVRGPHDAHFYKAMEEIEEQYAVFLAKGVVVDKDGFPLCSSEAHVLGSGGGGGGNRNNRGNALDAAESRRKKGQHGLTSGYRLGGSKVKSQTKDPREAARIAAERRLLDAQYCLPCSEVIEILGDSSDEEEIDDDDDDDDEIEIMGTTKGAKKSRRQKEDSYSNMKPAAKKSDDDCIDLTLDDSFDLTPVKKKPSKKKSKRATKTGDDLTWACPRCTLSNSTQNLACDACGNERPSNKTILEHVKELKREDDIANIKEKEVTQSLKNFGGFNIYGSKRNASGKMNHLT